MTDKLKIAVIGGHFTSTCENNPRKRMVEKLSKQIIAQDVQLIYVKESKEMMNDIQKSFQPISDTGSIRDLSDKLIEETSFKLEKFKMDIIDDSYKIHMTNSINGSKNGQLEKRISKNRKKNKLAKKARKRN